MEHSGKLTLKEFRFFIFSPIIPINDLRDLNGAMLGASFPYWRKYNLMPFIQKGSWNVKISMGQVIWLRILDHLRAFSFKVKDTQKVCDYLFKDAYTSELSQRNLESNRDLLKTKEASGTLDNNERKLLEQIEYTMKYPALQYALKLEINHLTELIMWCIDNREQAALLIYPGGEVLEQRGDRYYYHEEEKQKSLQPHIYLSISYFLEEFVESDELLTFVAPLLLNEDEQLVLNELKKGKVELLEIKCPDGNNIRVESVEDYSSNEKMAKDIRRVLSLRNYDEIAIRTTDGKVLEFKKKIL